ncbi:MAG: tetratricopeptide repeat protein, partial [Xanthobacteraceae bacterium]
ARRYDEAIAQLRKTLEIDPTFYYAHYNLGMALQRKGDVPRCILQLLFVSSRLRKLLQPARIASLSSLISWAMPSRLVSLPLLGKERLLFLLGTNHFLD